MQHQTSCLRRFEPTSVQTSNQTWLDLSSYSFCPLETCVIKHGGWANFRAEFFVPPLLRSCSTLRQRSPFYDVSELSHEVEPASFVSVPCQASHQLPCRCLHALIRPSLLYHNPWASSTASQGRLGKFRCRLKILIVLRTVTDSSASRFFRSIVVGT